MLGFFAASAFDSAANLATIVTAILAVAMIVIGIIVKNRSSASLSAYKNVAVGVCVGFAIGILTILMYLKYAEYAEQGYIDNATFIPVSILLGVIIIFAIAALIISVFAPEKFRTFSKIALSVIGIAFLTFIVIKMIKSGESSEILGSAALLYIFTAAIVAAIAVIFALCCTKRDGDSAKSIVYAAISVAMSFALSYLRLFELPQGGSITFASLLPLMLYSFMFGGRKGVLAGAVYGVLQFIQAPWFMHPVQFLLDYPIAFAAIGLTGFVREMNIFGKRQTLQFCFGAFIATVLRYAAHVVSGIFVFGSGDPENYGAVAWSFLYNAFTFADLAIVLVVAVILLSTKTGARLVNQNSIIHNDAE